MKTLYVDIDGTLLRRGWPNVGLIAFLRKQQAQGVELIAWSARGREYAEEAVRQLGIVDLFFTVIGKPTHIIDDQAWSWIRYVGIVRRWENDGGCG